MTEQEERDREIERAKERFAPLAYIIKDHYSGPGAPYLAWAFYMSADRGYLKVPVVDGFVKTVTLGA